MLNPQSDFLHDLLAVTSRAAATATTASTADEDIASSAALDRQKVFTPTFIARVTTGDSNVTSWGITLQHRDLTTDSWADVGSSLVKSSGAISSGGTGVILATYLGDKRYVRGQVTTTTGSTAATVAVDIHGYALRKVGKPR